MLKNETRKMLKKKTWSDFLKESGNPSQKKGRIEEQVIVALADLVLLYEKMDKEDRNVLFNLHNLKKLFDTLQNAYDLNDIVKMDVALYMMKKSIEIFKEKCSENNKDSYTIANLINEHLDKAFDICDDLVNREKISQSQGNSTKSQEKYLCSWYKIIKRDRNILKEFIKNKVKFIPKNFDIYHDLKTDIISGQFENNEGRIYTIKFTINKVESTAFLLIQSVGDHFQQRFTIHNRNDEYLLYYSPSGFEKGFTASLTDSLV
jgi:hypothetical protein